MGGQPVAQAGKPRGDSAAGKAGNLRDLGPRMPFEPQQDDLRVEQRERADDRMKAGERMGIGCSRFAAALRGQWLDVVDIDLR